MTDRDFSMRGQERKAPLEDFFALCKENLEQVFVKANLFVMVIGLSGVQIGL